MVVQEIIHGFIVECERTIIDEQGTETKESIFYKVNAPTNQMAYRYVQDYIGELGNISIKGVIKEYTSAPFTGIIL